MERDPLVYAVIGHAMAVHRALGPGLDELFYHQLFGKRDLQLQWVLPATKPNRVGAGA